MKLERIKYTELNSRQKEVYNFQKIAAILADYGFNCIKLTDDWQGADFLAYHGDGINTLRVQLKSRPSIDKKYLGKNLYVAFPANRKDWYLIEHDCLVEIVGRNTNWLNTQSWMTNGSYTSGVLSKNLLAVLAAHKLNQS